MSISTRSTTASRPRLFRRLAFAVLLLLGLLFVLWVALAIPGWSQKPGVRTDLIKTWNEPLAGLSESQRAWPLLRSAHEALAESSPVASGLDPSELSTTARFQFLEGLADLGQAHGAAAGPPFETRWRELIESGSGGGFTDQAAVRGWYDAVQPTLTEVRRAVQRSSLGLPYWIGAPTDAADRRYFLDPAVHDDLEAQGWPAGVSSLPALEIELPALGDLRLLSRLLCGDASLAAHFGDGARAVEDLIAVQELAALMADRTLLIEQLVGHAMMTMGVQSLIELLSDHGASFSDRDLDALGTYLAGIEPERFAVDLDGERQSFEHLLQLMYSDDGAGDGVLLIGQMNALGAMAPVPSSGFVGTVLGPFVNIYVPSRKEASAIFGTHLDLIESGSRGSLLEIDWADIDAAARSATPQGASIFAELRCFPLSLFMMRGDSLLTMNRIGRADRDAARVIIALMQYHRRNGAWPSSLDALVPELLPAVPIDPHDDAPLKYAVRDGAPLLWSVGANRSDESGRSPSATAEADGAARRFVRPDEPVTTDSGDWILWRGPVRP